MSEARVVGLKPVHNWLKLHGIEVLERRIIPNGLVEMQLRTRAGNTFPFVATLDDPLGSVKVLDILLEDDPALFGAR